MHSTTRLRELDSLRGIAAFSVLLFHYTLAKPEFHNIFSFGSTGVDLFFIISGFVIFLTIQKSATAKSFLISRFARIYPAYWVCVTITSAIFIGWTLATRQPVTFPSPKEYVINLTMLQYYFDVRNIDKVYWTLIYELLFYLFILFIYLSGGLKKIIMISYAIIVFCLVNTILIKPAYPAAFETIIKYFPLIVYFPLFIAGITFYQLKFKGSSPSRYLLLAACFIAQALLFPDAKKMAYITQAQYFLMLAIFFSIFLLYTKNRLGFIVNPVTLFLGKISYSLYLIHNLIGYAVIIPVLMNSKHFKLNIWVAIFGITIPLVIILATLINKYVEVPANKYIKRKLAGN